MIVTQAGVAEAAVRRWEAALDSCVGPSGGGDDTGASCTRAAWDQLFDQMYAVQYELLDLMGRMSRGGPCRETLASALDVLSGVDGLAAGDRPAAGPLGWLARHLLDAASDASGRGAPSARR